MRPIATPTQWTDLRREDLVLRGVTSLGLWMKLPAQLSFMSIVLCAYNSERVIARALDSLFAQDYPAELYEVIVIDDGSSDRTAEIVEKYPARLVRHETNLGRGAARNTGLDYIKGDVYVCFDDDCVVSPNWLRQLATGYRQPNVAGVGSALADSTEVHGIASRFMIAAGGGQPPSLRLDSSRHFLRRFLSYFADQISPEQPGARIYRVRELYSATASFPVEILRAVGGWDTSLRAMEDRDLCARIIKAYPNFHFYAVPTAHIVHDPSMTLLNLLRRSYVRGPENLRFYRENNLVPPIFPFPFAWLVTTASIAAAGPVPGILAGVSLPQVLYPWWPIRAIRERNPWNLLFAYIQLAEESASVVGLLRGGVTSRRGQ
jgi:glycosyltransferase involved in cell wall biosynthesis